MTKARELVDDEVLVLVRPHVYPEDVAAKGSCLVPAAAHEDGKCCTYCERCGKMVKGGYWSSGCDG